MSVLVKLLTKSALVDMNEQRSPKNTPDKIAPPVKIGLIPIALDMVMQIIPKVAADPNAVPVRKEIKQHSKKVTRINTDGVIIFEE